MFLRLAEARSIITHGLGENAAAHEAYMVEFRQMVAQVERIYPLWLIDRGAKPELAAVTSSACAHLGVFRGENCPRCGSDVK